jgi:hypothetical protein
MKKTFFIFLFSLIFLMCTKKQGTGNSSSTVDELLLKSNELSGWVASSSKWYVNSDTDLYSRIDGKAPIYVRHHFSEAAGQLYSGKIDQDTMSVSLYVFEMKDTRSVRELSDEFASDPFYSFSPVLWETDYLTWAMTDQISGLQSLFGYKSTYFIYIQISSGTDKALEVLKMFANNIGIKVK